jgi:hypothetical protein
MAAMGPDLPRDDRRGKENEPPAAAHLEKHRVRGDDRQRRAE